MIRTFLETSIFTKNWSKMELSDDSLRELQEFILKNPNAGAIIQGTGGLVKLRFPLPNTGKSGGVRVLYVDFTHQEKIFLINCYSKSEKDSVTDKEKAEYKALIKSIKEELK